MSELRQSGPVEKLCREIGEPFDPRLERPEMLLAFVRELVAEVADMMAITTAIAHLTSRSVSEPAAAALAVAELMVAAATPQEAIQLAEQVHDVCQCVTADDAPADRHAEMLSACASAVRFGLEVPCRSRHAADAGQQIWANKYGVTLSDDQSPGWQQQWARRIFRRALATSALASWNRRAPSAEEARLRAEVASLRATLGQQPAVEGAEPIGCPLPGACGAVRAHAAAYRAGAEAMREAAAVVAQTVRVPHMNIAPDKYAIGVEIAAAIRALPLPAGGSGWRPIETAPIDQEIDIWVARSEDGHAYSHGYRQERVVWNATEAYWEGERTAIFPQQATHWQPLPAAPEDTP